MDTGQGVRLHRFKLWTQWFTDKPTAKTAQQPLIGSVWISPVEGHNFMGFQSSEVDGSDSASTWSEYGRQVWWPVTDGHSFFLTCVMVGVFIVFLSKKIKIRPILLHLKWNISFIFLWTRGNCSPTIFLDLILRFCLLFTSSQLVLLLS